MTGPCRGFFLHFIAGKMRWQEGMGPAPGHTATKLQSWIRTHILVTLANRRLGHASLSWWRDRMGGPSPGAGPTGQQVEKVLAASFHQRTRVKCFLIAKLVLKRQSTQKTSGSEPRRRARWWGTQDTAPLT